LHLEDCRLSAYESVAHGLQVLDCVTEWIDTQQTPQPLWDAGDSFLNRLATLQGDLRHLRNQFTSIAAEIVELQGTVRTHLHLTQDRQNFILFVLASVYLPLSLTTSFFGMNMRTTIPASRQGFSNWTASWIENLPVETRNSTKALVSTIGSSRNLTHSWKTFTITTACLFFTLPLSLTIGAISRKAYRGTINFATTHWRILAVYPILTFVVCSGGWMGNIIYFICNGFLILFLSVKLYQAWKSNQGVRPRFLMLCLTSLIFGLDNYLYHFFNGIPLMMIPWLILLYASVQPLFWPWWMRWRRRRQADNAQA